MKRMTVLRKMVMLFTAAVLFITMPCLTCAEDIGSADTGAAADEAGETGEISRDLLIRLNRSDLEWLSEMEGPCYVFGHQTPDADTVCTAIAYAYILRSLGYDAQPAVLGPINRETAYILNSAGVDIPPVLEDASGKNVVLVDHSDYSQSAEGLEDANIVMIIDHHRDGSVTTDGPLIYDARPLGSTATVAWIRSLNYGVELDQKTAFVLLGAVLSDTNNLKAGMTTEADREAVRILSGKAGIEDVNAFYQRLYRESISYEGMTDEEILLSDLRKYEDEGTPYIIGAVSCYDEEDARDLAERMKAVLPEVMASEGAELGYAQISIFHDDISITYIVPSDEKAAELLETAFGEEAVKEGISYVLRPGISRRQVLVPRLSEALSLHPKE